MQPRCTEKTQWLAAPAAGRPSPQSITRGYAYQIWRAETDSLPSPGVPCLGDHVCHYCVSGHVQMHVPWIVERSPVPLHGDPRPQINGFDIESPAHLERLVDERVFECGQPVC